jgi:hypothetical protein
VQFFDCEAAGGESAKHGASAFRAEVEGQVV